MAPVEGRIGTTMNASSVPLNKARALLRAVRAVRAVARKSLILLCGRFCGRFCGRCGRFLLSHCIHYAGGLRAVRGQSPPHTPPARMRAREARRSRFDRLPKGRG
jgi:hypothetical protein